MFVRIRGHAYPVILPSIRDSRLHVAAVITSLQILGQTALDFELSIAQILVSLGTCAFIEIGIIFFTRRELAWPASALLTGNGIAFLLRVDGTEHGQWWSLRGAHIFAATAAVGVLSKYVIRWRGRPLFNPSNIALVLCFLVLGTDRVNPLDFWWGPMSAAMVAVYVIILTGGAIINTRVKMWSASLAFWLTFAAATGVLAQRGQCFTARWHVGPVCDGTFWRTLVTSPEVLIFLFFMITDPKTAPLGRLGRTLYGALVGFLAAIFIATQSTEFGAKVAVLGALVVVCALRPLLEIIAPVSAPRVRWNSVRSSGVRWSGVSMLVALSLVIVIPRSGAVETRGAETFVLTDTTTSPSDADIVLPPVVISSAPRQLSNPITDAQAQVMARDLLSQLRQKEPAPQYQFERLTVVVMRANRSSQAVPKLAIRAEGVVAVTGERADRTFSMVDANGRFVLEFEYETASVILD